MSPRDVAQLRYIRKRLEQAIEIGWMSRKDRDRTFNQIGSMVLDALDLAEHPFTIALEELDELRNELAQQQCEWPRVKRTLPGDEAPAPYLRTLFQPRPGAVDPLSQKFWPIQLLLLIAAEPQTLDRLALRLGFGPDSIFEACKSAKKAEVGDWSPRQALQNVLQAMSALEMDEGSEFVLSGRTLSRGTTSVRLSQTEGRYLNLLVQARGRGVTKEAFSKQDIKNVRKLKSRFLAKLADSEMHLSIRPGPLGAHVLDDQIRVEQSSE